MEQETYWWALVQGDLTVVSREWDKYDQEWRHYIASDWECPIFEGEEGFVLLEQIEVPENLKKNL